MDDHLHWFPKIQFGGTGLTLVSTLAPTLGYAVPYALRAGGAILGVLMIAWPLFAYLGQLLRSARSMLPKTIVALGVGAALLGWNYWYSLNYSRNGGVWHIELGITPRPPLPAPPPQVKPKEPEKPWVTPEEVTAFRIKGRDLIAYSPNDIVYRIAYYGFNLKPYIGSWVKFSDEFWTMSLDAPLPDKKIYYNVPPRGAFFNNLLFDVDRWKHQLIPLAQGQHIDGYCQIYGVVDHRLYFYNCELN
jgi:hypothetical protein